jgi:hypothetical protein
VKYTALALALVVLLLLSAHPLFASDPSLSPDDASLSRCSHATRAVTVGCPAEEASVLAYDVDFGWRQPSLFTNAEASSLIPAHPAMPAEEEPMPLTTGAWFMGVGLVVFIISRNRFKN